jgi:hypothetical protein
MEVEREEGNFWKPEPPRTLAGSAGWTRSRHSVLFHNAHLDDARCFGKHAPFISLLIGLGPVTSHVFAFCTMPKDLLLHCYESKPPQTTLRSHRCITHSESCSHVRCLAKATTLASANACVSLLQIRAINAGIAVVATKNHRFEFTTPSSRNARNLGASII